MGTALIIAAAFLAAGAVAYALLAPRPQARLRTVADPAAVGETGAHRGEIAAPDALPPDRPTEVSGYRYTGPSGGTYSGERWRTTPVPPAPVVVPPHTHRQTERQQAPVAVAYAGGGSAHHILGLPHDGAMGHGTQAPEVVLPKEFVDAQTKAAQASAALAESQAALNNAMAAETKVRTEEAARAAKAAEQAEAKAKPAAAKKPAGTKPGGTK